MATQPSIRFSSNDSYAPKPYTPTTYTAGTYEQPYKPSYQPVYVSTGYPVDNRQTNFVGVPDARNTYTVSPSAATSKVHFNHSGAAYAPVNTVYQPPTVVTGSTAPVVQVPQTSYVRETEVVTQQSHYVKSPPSALKQDDDFLCGRTGWIIGVLIALILLALALCYGLGAFGGNGSAGAASVAAGGPSPTAGSGTAPESTPAAPRSTTVSPTPAGASAGTSGSAGAAPAKSVPPKPVDSVKAHMVHSRHLKFA